MEIKREDDEIGDSRWLDMLNKEDIFFEEARSQPSSSLKDQTYIKMFLQALHIKIQTL